MIFYLASNTTFTEYGKVLVLDFSEFRNTFLFLFKSYLLGIFYLSMKFQNFGNTVFGAVMKECNKMKKLNATI